MPAIFDHEKLKVYQDSLRFVAWADPIIERLPTRVAARDQLDRSSTSIPLNLAEGNGRRSPAERCRFFDIARGSEVESAACLDVLLAKKRISDQEAAAGKAMLIEIVSMTAGLIAHFSKQVHEGPAEYEVEIQEKE